MIFDSERGAHLLHFFQGMMTTLCVLNVIEMNGCSTTDVVPFYRAVQPTDTALLGRFLRLCSKRHLRCCGKFFFFFCFCFFFFFYLFITICHPALPITPWLYFPTIWSTDVQHTRIGRCKFRIYFNFFYIRPAFLNFH